VRYEVVSGKKYPVYSQEEADELGLSYKHPFYVLEGEYGISSDKEVGQCLRRSTLKNGRLSVKYPWGPSFVYDEKDSIKSEGRINNYTISGKNNRGKYIKGRDDFQKLAYLMAQPGMSKEVAIRTIFGILPSTKKYAVKKTMRTEVFKKMTKDELDKIVEQFPIGKIDTARALAAILDKVMDWDGDDMGPKGDPKIAISVLDKLMDMNDMKSKGKVITTQQIEASTVETTLADIQEKKKLFKATQTEESDGLEPTTEKEEESKQEES
jgi:hypothetical protein